MRLGRVRTAAVAAIVVVAGFTAFLATRPTAQGAVSLTSPKVGALAVLPRAATTVTGATVALGARRGHVIVLSFFASWCGPCHTEAPDLAAFDWFEHDRVGGAELFGVVYNDANVSVRRFMQSYGLEYPAIEDPGGALANQFGVIGPPTTVVISPDGRVANVLVGAVTATQLEAASAQAAKVAS